MENSPRKSDDPVMENSEDEEVEVKKIIRRRLKKKDSLPEVEDDVNDTLQPEIAGIEYDDPDDGEDFDAVDERDIDDISDDEERYLAMTARNEGEEEEDDMQESENEDPTPAEVKYFEGLP